MIATQVTLTFLFSVFTFTWIGAHDLWYPKWFRMGSGEEFLFFNGKINTTERYLWLMIFLIILYTVNALAELYIEPFYGTHVRGIYYPKYTSFTTALITAMYRIYKMIFFLFSIHIAMSQFDIWFAVTAVDVLTHTIHTLVSQEKKINEKRGFTVKELEKLQKFAESL